jgi:hypothetical protein
MTKKEAHTPWEEGAAVGILASPILSWGRKKKHISRKGRGVGRQQAKA